MKDKNIGKLNDFIVYIQKVKGCSRWSILWSAETCFRFVLLRHASVHLKLRQVVALQSIVQTVHLICDCLNLDLA